MADDKDASPEQAQAALAFELMKEVLKNVEHKSTTTQKELLDTYAECLQAVQGRREIKK